MKTAALAYVTREDGGILVAWNRKHGGWSLPGGKIADKENLLAGLTRELYEEANLLPLFAEFVYSAPSGAKGSDTLCHVFKVEVDDIEHLLPIELNTPCGWMDRETFMKHSLWPEWHKRMFEAIDARAKATVVPA